MPRQNRTTPHQPFRFSSSCDQKRRFAREKEAEKAAEIQMLVQPNLELSVYKCDLCTGWHLTRHTKTN